jgi:DNA-binding NarL/FixJ family response regulator
MIMSDASSTLDAAIELLHKREREIDADIQMHLARAAGATSVRDELRDLIASLSRKPRARKPRGIEAAAEPTTSPEPRAEPEAAPAPAPTVPWSGFALTPAAAA